MIWAVQLQLICNPHCELLFKGKWLTPGPVGYVSSLLTYPQVPLQQLPVSVNPIQVLISAPTLAPLTMTKVTSGNSQSRPVPTYRPPTCHYAATGAAFHNSVGNHIKGELCCYYSWYSCDWNWYSRNQYCEDGRDHFRTPSPDNSRFGNSSQMTNRRCSPSPYRHLSCLKPIWRLWQNTRHRSSRRQNCKNPK